MPYTSWFFKERCCYSTAYGSFRATGDQAGPAGGFHPVEGDCNPVNGVSGAALGNRENSLAQWATDFMTDSGNGFAVEVGVGKSFEHDATVSGGVA